MKRIVMLLLVYFLSGCGTAQPELYVSNNADCSVPCWHGIMPGKSTIVETETVLRSLSFVSELDFNTSSKQGVTTACWQFITSMAYGCATFKNATLQYLRIRPKDLHLGEVIDRIGIPDHIIAGYEPAETIVYGIDLYYPTKGVAITVADSPIGTLSDAQRITRELNVVQIQYFAPTDLETFLTEIDGRSRDSAQSVLEHLQPWPGYGPNVVRIGR